MTQPPDDAALVARLRKRLAEAPAQPWAYRPDKYDDWGMIRGPVRDDLSIGPFRPIVARGHDSMVSEADMSAHRVAKTDPYGPSSLLIVDAVNALPGLLDALEAKDRRIAELEGQVIVNDYQRAAFAIFRKRLDGRKIQVGFIPAAQCLSDEGEKVSGFTLFPDDGTEPEIWISDDTPVLGVPDVLFHELAHVLAGHDAGHSEAFTAVEESLWADMDRYCAALEPSDKGVGR